MTCKRKSPGKKALKQPQHVWRLQISFQAPDCEKYQCFLSFTIPFTNPVRMPGTPPWEIFCVKELVILSSKVSPDQLVFAPTGPVGVAPDGSGTPNTPVMLSESL